MPVGQPREKNPPELLMSEKQIAASVRFGRKVTFCPFDNEPVTGYVGGWDRYNYFVLVPDDHRANGSLQVGKYLVHKSVPVIRLHDESTFDREPPDVLEELKNIMAKFKTYVQDSYYPERSRA